MSGDSERGSRATTPGLAVPSILMVVVAAYAYLNSSPPLETARPEAASEPGGPAPRTVGSIGAVQARLWEDPLEAAYRDQKEKQADDPLPLQPGAFGKMVEDTAKEANGNGKPLLFMPVLVPGGSYAEDKEDRMRTRYAVLAALGTCHYKLAMGKRMSYVRVPVVTDFQATGGRVHGPLTVPVKLFRPGKVEHDRDHHHHYYGGVLVCWIDQSQLGSRPLAVILQVFNRMFPQHQRNQIRVSILGPSSSDMLLDMYQEDQQWKAMNCPVGRIRWPVTKVSEVLSQQFDSCICEIPDWCAGCWEWFMPAYGEFPNGTRLFSTRATVWPGVVKSPEGNRESIPGFCFSNNNVTFVPVVGTDQQLVEQLSAELKLRDAWPTQKFPTRHIVLVTERDTLYGCALPETFKRKLELEGGAQIAEDNLHVFTYLRGVDGALSANDAKTGRKATKSPNKSSEDAPPDGRAQLDYIRRRERSIVGLPKSLADEEIVAIGVIGSDVYDKLLILRSLRPRFPKAWFFTTDLDARFSHAHEYDYTRNLLVASHFALELHPDLQRSVPPFRESYQTANFLAGLMALEDKDTAEALKWMPPNDPWGILPETKGGKGKRLQPLMFEIGRTMPYQFATVGQSSVSAAVHPANSRGQLWILEWDRFFWGAAAFVFFMVCLACNLNLVAGAIEAVFRSKLLAVILFIPTCAVVVLMLIDGACPEGEPVVFFEGISVWPSTLIRYLTALLSISLLCKSWSDLKKNGGKLCKEYFDVTQRPAPATKRRLRWPCSNARRRERPKDDAKVSAGRLCQEYLHEGRSSNRIRRVGALTVCYLLFGMSLFKLNGFPNSPYRGDISEWIEWVVRLVAVCCMIALVFFVLDATQVCRRFVRKLAAETRDWPDGPLQRLVDGRKANAEDGLRELLIVRFIAERTAVVGKLMLYPFCVILLLILSRHWSLDRWSFSWPLVVVVTLNLGAAVVCALSLRLEASKARRTVLRSLADQHAQLAGSKASDRGQRLDQFKLVIAEIEQEQRGAFRPFREDPLLFAIAIPFGGVGSLWFINQLMSLT